MSTWIRLDTHLCPLDAHFTSLDTHLTSLEAHLTAIDANLSIFEPSKFTFNQQFGFIRSFTTTYYLCFNIK